MPTGADPLPDDPKDESLPAPDDAEPPSDEASCDEAPADDSPIADEDAAEPSPGAAGDAPPDAAPALDAPGEDADVVEAVGGSADEAPDAADETPDAADEATDAADEASADDSPIAEEDDTGPAPGAAGDAPPDGADHAADAAEEDAPGDARDFGPDEEDSDAGDEAAADKIPDASGADVDAGPVWGPPGARLADTLAASHDADDSSPADSVDGTLDNDSWSPPLRSIGTPLRLPAVRARRPGVLATVLRAGWEELNYPRARVRAGMRRALNRMKERRLVASLLWGTLAGATFILYASGAGMSRGIVAWTVFAGVAVGMIAGGPAALVHAWPAAIVAPIVACAWAGWAFGPGALWLGMATCAGLLVLYFAAAEVAPLVGAAGVAWLVLHPTGLAQSPGALVIAGIAFVLSAACFIAMRKRVTAPIMAACWVLLSGATAARVAWWALGASAPATWALESLAGPGGLAACVAGAAFGMALFSWPRRRESRARPVFDD